MARTKLATQCTEVLGKTVREQGEQGEKGEGEKREKEDREEQGYVNTKCYVSE